MIVMAWWNLIAFMITNQAVLLLGEKCFDFASPGYVTPKNDTYLSVGEPLRINCILRNVNATHTARNIIWTLTNSNKTHLNPAATQMVISNTTSQLTIMNTTIHDSAGYSCKLKTNASDVLINICSVTVKVGYAPPKNAKINCEVQGWTQMKCTWKQPANPIGINWKFQFNRNNRKNNCTNYIDGNQGCIIKDVPFRAMPCFYIFLNGSNQLKSNVGTQWGFPLDQRVILNKPGLKKQIETTENNAEIKWSVDSKDSLNITCQLHYYCDWSIDQCKTRVTVIHIPAKRQITHSPDCSKNGSSESKQPGIKPRANSEMLGHKTLHGLIPYTNYSVSIRCQIQSTVFPEKWSEMANVTFKTKPAVPRTKPDIIVEDTEMVTNTSINLILYWKEIPKYLKNGNKFWYEVRNGIDRPWSANDSVITLKNLKNERGLVITSCNEMGCANSSTPIIVPSKMDSKLLQVYAVQYYPGNIYEVTWRMVTSNVPTNHFIILKCTVRNSDSSPKAEVPCNNPLEVLRANVTAVHKVNVTRRFSNSVPALTSYTVYSMNLTCNLPDSGYKYKFAVAIRNESFSSGLISVSCTVDKAHQQIKVDSIKEGMEWAEIKWEVPNGCLRKDSEGYNISYWSGDKKFEVSLDDPFATVVNLTGLSPNTNYEGKLITRGLRSSEQPFSFQTKDDHSNSQMLVVIGSMFGCIVFIGVLITVTLYLVKKIKIKVKELKNIQIPSGLREDFNTFHRPPLLSQESTELAMTKFDTSLMHVPSSPPASEKITNGSNSSGFGSDFQGSTTSSPTTSFSSANHTSQECNTDLDTPSIIAVRDSVFESAFDPVTSYSLVGKSASNDIQLLNPSLLDRRDYDADLSLSTLPYAKVAARPVELHDDINDIPIAPVEMYDDQLGPSHDPYYFSKGYTTLAAAELTMQPYVKVALEADATQLNPSREKQLDAVDPLAYVSVGMNNNNRNFSEGQLNNVAAGGSGLGYVSCSFLDDPVDYSCATSHIEDTVIGDNDGDIDDDDSLLSFEDINVLNKMDDDDDNIG